MSNYKHGNWYCKPANEAEAIEIVERAVASGAELFESVGEDTDKYRWNLREYWGVTNGYTYNSNKTLFIYDAIYTIEQVRAKFPLPSELQVNVGPHFEHEQKEVVRSDVDVSVGSKPVQWNGKGLPPIGTVCTLKECGTTVEIIAHTESVGHKVAVFQYLGGDGGLVVQYRSEHYFCQIKTEREKFIGDVHDGYDGGAHHSTVMEIAGRIYDALRSGTLKAPEVNK